MKFPAIFCAGLLVFAAHSGNAQPISPRELVLEAMRQRPNDPWPRGQGHVVLAAPGTSEDLKAYHEPGGSFSPAFASFGVSIWIGDEQGRMLSTSDTLPLEKIKQEFIWPKDAKIPAIKTETEYYDCVWSSAGPGSWTLKLSPKIAPRQRLLIAVRSVGPSGGELKPLKWFYGDVEQNLEVRGRWKISFTQRPSGFDFSDGVGERLTSARFRGIDWKTDEDWGYATFSYPANGPYEKREFEIRVKDLTEIPPAPLKVSKVGAALKLDLPDKQFVECLNAQAAHLLMGLVRNETRPGDPNNYPLNWLRDGAYEIVALVRCGQLEVAKKLCEPFAENDFFGGFGSEADGPGLALWALTETAVPAGDKKFEQWLWPHVQRKVGLIEEMLAATNALRKPFAGPIVPGEAARTDVDLVCDAAVDGLINGRMDWHRPVLFVNAVTYRGLVAAADFAARAGQASEAAAWLNRAAELRKNWNAAFNAGKFPNERNFICALYPTFVADDAKAFQERFAIFFAGTHDTGGELKGMPLWTYFNLAQAHQWLALGQPDKVWTDLQWFRQHQASPGLYTWWEGKGEVNNFGRWAQLARGWVNPAHVTPHYWTAAEMLLLQMDLLAFVDETAEPTLVLGAGVPKEWLEKTLVVEGLGTRFGRVDWKWHDGKMTVKQYGKKLPVKMGANFPEAK